MMLHLIMAVKHSQPPPVSIKQRNLVQSIKFNFLCVSDMNLQPYRVIMLIEVRREKLIKYKQ